MRKYRLIIFVLLAWCIYMVVAKEFDFVLAYLISQKLPNHLLGHLILPAFVAVELQVLMLTLFMKRSQETQQSKSMIISVITGRSSRVYFEICYEDVFIIHVSSNGFMCLYICYCSLENYG